MDDKEGVRIVLVLGLHYIHVMGDAVITVAVLSDIGLPNFFSLKLHLTFNLFELFFYLEIY
jgi:hypothetical protein